MKIDHMGNMKLRLKPAIGSEEDLMMKKLHGDGGLQRTSTPNRKLETESYLRKQLLEKIKKERQAPRINHGRCRLIPSAS